MGRPRKHWPVQRLTKKLLSPTIKDRFNELRERWAKDGASYPTVQGRKGEMLPNLTGFSYGGIKVVAFWGYDWDVGYSLWLCECEHGGEVLINHSAFVLGHSCCMWCAHHHLLHLRCGGYNENSFSPSPKAGWGDNVPIERGIDRFKHVFNWIKQRWADFEWNGGPYTRIDFAGIKDRADGTALKG